MKRLLAITISLIIILPQMIGTSMAAEEFSCTNVQTDTTGFYVILEEPLGGPDAKYCFRVCKNAEVKPGQASAGNTKTRICELKDTCVGGGALTDNVNCQRIQIIQADGGLDLLNQYVRMIYLWSAGVIGIIAVLIIVVSGIEMMITGSSGSIDEAKSRIVKSLLGLVILFLSGLILYTINPTFFV